MVTIVTYNLNGIRSAMSKGLTEWLGGFMPEIICFQELKAQVGQFDVQEFQKMGYHDYWFPAEKKGYSGVGILSKIKPDNIYYGMDMPTYDYEGRMIRADYGNCSVISVYHPSGSSGDERQEFKMKWLSDFSTYIKKLKTERPNLIISGDFNICHKPIDIHDPIRNVKSSGFLPEEREWMDSFVTENHIDTFRVFNSEPKQYSWWSFRAGARAKNLGWRIDYNFVTESLSTYLRGASILMDVVHSDHCPVVLQIDESVF